MSVLSPAFRDRWLLWHHAEVPGEAGFAAMLRCLLFGEQSAMSQHLFKPQRRSRFVAELEQLARLIAFRPELRLTLGRPGSCWSFDAATGTISIDSGRLETESEDFTRGLVLHESAHATITRLLDHLEPLADPVRARLGALPESASGGTNLGGVQNAAAGAIQDAPGRDRFVLVLSDGLPNNVSSARAGLARFTALGCHVFGLGLGPETFALRELIPSSRVNLSATEVPAALANPLMECTRIRAMTL